MPIEFNMNVLRRNVSNILNDQILVCDKASKKDEWNCLLTEEKERTLCQDLDRNGCRVMKTLFNQAVTNFVETPSVMIIKSKSHLNVLLNDKIAQGIRQQLNILFKDEANMKYHDYVYFTR